VGEQLIYAGRAMIADRARPCYWFVVRAACLLQRYVFARFALLAGYDATGLHADATSTTEDH
jgi:hypothetical protein